MTLRADVTVVIPCSKTKRRCPEPAASIEELGRCRFGDASRLEAFAVEARELYLGRQHRQMVRAVDALRHARPGFRVKLAIVSAGYGLLAEHDPVIPYEAALGGSRRAQAERGRQLGLPGAVRQLAEISDCTVFALSAAYLAACGLPDPTLEAVYLAGASTEALGCATISSGRREARDLGRSEREVRGYVLSLLLEDIARRGMATLQDARAGSWASNMLRQASMGLP
jgi:hypothetical protein